MRVPVALCLALLTAACAGHAPAPASRSIGTTIVARVVASREMAVVGSATPNFDVNFDERTAHRIAPRDNPGTSFVALATSADCPASGDPGRLYEMSFVRRRFAFGITNAVDRQWTTDLEIASCRLFAGE
jgi:hypothetical protein